MGRVEGRKLQETHPVPPGSGTGWSEPSLHLSVRRGFNRNPHRAWHLERISETTPVRPR